MNIVSRAGWGAAKPAKPLTYVAPSKRRYFVVHHSGAPSTQSVKAIQDWCINGRGFNDIDYNFLVDQQGRIYEGRGWDAVGAHTTNYNTSGVGVCVIGNNELSDAAKRSVRWLYDAYSKRCGKTLAIRGHRNLATTGTTCPGDRIMTWLKSGMRVAGAVSGGTDVAITDADAAKVARAVWALAYQSAGTEKRWPDRPKRSMQEWLAVGVFFGHDVQSWLAKNVKPGLDVAQPDVAVLAAALRAGLSDDDRLALAAALA